MSKSNSNAVARATLATIAKQAGVSISCASTVLNNMHVERRISLETVERVRSVALKLGYLPDINARILSRGSQLTRNLVVAHLTSYEAPLSLADEMIRELRLQFANPPEALAGATFSLMMDMFEAGKLSKLPGLMTGSLFNAAVITNTAPEDDRYLDRSYLPYPAVIVNRYIARYFCVVEDPAAGAQAADVLIRDGRRSLAVLYGDPLSQSARSRVNSFVQTVAARLGKAAHELPAKSLTVEGAYDAMLAFLKAGVSVDGLYAASDSMAMGAYRALKENGFEIPSDIGVIGVGDFSFSGFFDPPLTIVGVNRRRFGSEVGKLLMQQLDKSPPPPVAVTVPVETLMRGSTGRGARTRVRARR